MLQEILDVIVGTRKKLSRVVCCPKEPLEIQGIAAADALDAGDAMGRIFTIRVPYSGIIYSATWWDLDDENKQTDIMVFKRSIAQVASDDAWAPTDADLLKFVTALVMVPTVDHTNARTAELTNIGKAYTAPEGVFYCQAVDRGGQTIAAANMPKFQLQIIPDDPFWEEE